MTRADTNAKGNEMTRNEIKAAGKVIIGEWGWSRDNAGWIVCDPSDREAVLAAYGEIPDGDLSQGVLAGVEAAGGEYVQED
jgi:hypothetical protein